MKPYFLRIFPVGLVVVGFLAMPLTSVAQPPSDQQIFEVNERDLVSSEQINRNGLKLDVRGTQVEVTSLRLARNPSQTCYLHVPDFVRLLSRHSGFQRSLRQAETQGGTAEAEVNLKAKVGPKGKVFCSDPGNSCVATVIVTVPEAMFGGPRGGRPQPQLR